MHHQHTRSDDRRGRREAFTLVEILVVLLIITILASMAFVVLGRTGEAAREAATKALMRQLQSALRERIEAFNDATASTVYTDPDTPSKVRNALFRQKVSELQLWFSLSPANAMLTPPTGEQVEIYVRKTLFKGLFPQRRRDLYGYDGVPQEINGFPDDSPLLVRMYSGAPAIGNRIGDSWLGRGLVDSSNAAISLAAGSEYQSANTRDDRHTESSELLYLALTAGDVFGMPPTPLDGIDRNLIGDTDNDGNLEFLDGWGQPIKFYNWPTRLLKDDGMNYWTTLDVGANTYPTAPLLMANLPVQPPMAGSSPRRPVAGSVERHSMYRDPQDMTKTMLRWNVYTAPYPAGPITGNPLSGSSLSISTFGLRTSTGANSTAQGFRPIWYHDANTPTKPLIVSVGPDGELGLYLPTEPDENRLARVIPTDEACQALGDNITNLQRGPN